MKNPSEKSSLNASFTASSLRLRRDKLSSAARAAFITAVCFASVQPAAFAGNTWTGGGSGAFNWSDNNNWGGGQPSYGTYTFAGSLGTINTVDLAYSTNILLWTGTSAWTTGFTGAGAISLFDNGGNQAKIENQSTGLVTLNVPITFAANNGSPTNPFGEINAVNGDITFGSAGTLTVNGSSVNGIKMFGANHATTFNNTVSASGKYFATTGVNTTVVIGGAFTSGNFFLMNGGILKLNAGGSLTTSGGNAEALRLGGDFGTTGSQDLTKGATFQLTPLTGGLTTNALINTVSGNTSGLLLIDSLNTSNTNTLAGDFYLDSALRVNQASGGTIVISDATTDIKGQTLTLTGSGGFVNLTGVVGNSTGSGQVVVGVNGTAGGPTVTMSQANTYSGDTFVRAGTLAFTSTGSAANSAIRLGSTSGTTVTANLNLTTLTGGTTISSVINPVTTSGTGVVTLNSQNTSGTNTLSGQIALDRALTVNQVAGGILNITQARVGTGTTTGNDIKGFTETLTAATGGTINVSGTIYNSTGSGAVSVFGGGNVVLSGNNTYGGLTSLGNNTTLTLSGDNIGMGGGITITTGTSISPQLNINSATALGTGTLLFTGGAATDTVRLDNTSSNSLVTVSTANAFDLRRDFTFVGTNSLNLGTGVATFGPSTTTGTRIISVTANTLTFGGSIKETGVYAMTKSGNGTLVFSGTGSTYSGLSSVSAGTLAGIGANAFGNTSNISIAAAGTLSLRGDSDTIFAKTIDNVTRYTVSTTASAATINVDQATAGNTAAKTMTIGTLTVGSAAATAQTKLTGTNGASLSVGAVTNTTAASGTTQFTNTISGGGSFTLASYTDTRTGTPTLKFDGSGNTTVTGAIAQNGVNTLALTYSGTGILTLNGASSFTGATTASSGTLLVNGGVAGTSSGTGTGSVSVTGTGSVLGGTGAISGNVSIGAGSKITGGTLGTSAANAAANVGTLNTGALTLNATSVFLVDIGTTTSFDKLSITGINNTLAGTLTLNIATGLTFTAGQQLSLIDNDGTDAFIGTFAGVAEGGAVTSGGYSFTASYRGTDGLTGNDFVLTATAVPEPSTWVGAGLISGLALNSLRRRRQSSI